MNADAQSRFGQSVSAILCTYNRCKILPRTLEQLAASQLPSSVSWEVLVVDNNSTDQTRDVVEDFCQRYPGIFRYVFEPTSGKSHAANAGIKQARGNVLAFVDDDVTLSATWLHNLTASLHDGTWAGAGGRILATQALEAPEWFSVEVQGAVLYGRFDFGEQPCELEVAPYGANMAFRKAIFEKYGAFRTDLGPGLGPETPRPNEDTELGRRLIAAGERLRYEPKAVVYHPVLPGRIRKEYFLSWWFDHGRASIVERGDRPAMHGIPWDYLSLFHRVMAILMLSLRGIFAGGKRERFHCKCLIWEQTGMMVELFRRSSRKRNKAAALS